MIQHAQFSGTWLRPLTFTDVAREEGSRHPGFLVVTRATAVTALPTRVVFTLTAKFLTMKSNSQSNQLCANIENASPIKTQL